MKYAASVSPGLLAGKGWHGRIQHTCAAALRLLGGAFILTLAY